MWNLYPLLFIITIISIIIIVIAIAVTVTIIITIIIIIIITTIIIVIVIAVKWTFGEISQVAKQIYKTCVFICNLHFSDYCIQEF